VRISLKNLIGSLIISALSSVACADNSNDDNEINKTLCGEMKLSFQANEAVIDGRSVFQIIAKKVVNNFTSDFPDDFKVLRLIFDSSQDSYSDLLVQVESEFMVMYKDEILQDVLIAEYDYTDLSSADVGSFQQQVRDNFVDQVDVSACLTATNIQGGFRVVIQRSVDLKSWEDFSVIGAPTYEVLNNQITFPFLEERIQTSGLGKEFFRAKYDANNFVLFSDESEFISREDFIELGNILFSF